MNGRRIALAGGAVFVLFSLLLLLTWAFKKDWKDITESWRSQISAIDKDLSAAQEEQVAMAGTISKSSSALLELQKLSESRMTRETDERLRSAWGSYRTGATLSRHQLLEIGQQLDALRGVTKELREVAVKTLTAVQDLISRSHENPAGSFVSPTEMQAALERLGRLDAAISASLQWLTELKNKIAETDSSLKERQREVAGLISKVAPKGDAAAQESVKAVEVTLEGIQLAQGILERVNKSATSVARNIFSARDILGAQRDFLRAVRKAD
jgi:hypothetical protein